MKDGWAIIVAMSETPAVPGASLYARLGGYDQIAAIVRGLFARMQADARFARFGTGRSIDSRRRTEQLTVTQLCALSGGPCYYTGRDMATAHRGLGITEEEWTASLEHTQAALQENGIAEREQQEFLVLFERYRNEIIDR